MRQKKLWLRLRHEEAVISHIREHTLTPALAHVHYILQPGWQFILFLYQVVISPEHLILHSNPRSADKIVLRSFKEPYAIKMKLLISSKFQDGSQTLGGYLNKMWMVNLLVGLQEDSALETFVLSCKLDELSSLCEFINSSFYIFLHCSFPVWSTAYLVLTDNDAAKKVLSLSSCENHFYFKLWFTFMIAPPNLLQRGLLQPKRFVWSHSTSILWRTDFKCCTLHNYQSGCCQVMSFMFFCCKLESKNFAVHCHDLDNVQLLVKKLGWCKVMFKSLTTLFIKDLERQLLTVHDNYLMIND